MTLKLPNIISHRACAGYAPENTIEGIHTAADMGVDWVELDVKLTRDQVPIIFHDDMLDRTTNTSGPISLLTYDEIKELDAGSWFGESFIGAKIPTLEEAVDVLIDRGLGLNLEIKPCPSREKETAEAALDVLSTIWDDHDKLLISSFSHVSLEVAFDMAETWHRGFLLPDHTQEDWVENWAEMIKYLNVSSVNLNGNTITRELVEDVLDLELPVLAYTINEPDRGRFLQAWGVDGFFTDVPDVLQETLFVVH